MSSKKNQGTPTDISRGFSRRSFLHSVSTLAAAQILGVTLPSPAIAAEPSLKKNKPSRQKQNRPNILFIFTDQERYFSSWPKGFDLPGHERLAKTGTTFSSHYISSTMCSSSRAVMLTGLQTPDNRIFENTDMPYVSALSTDTPTVGHMLRKAGYYTAYKGKWHLSRDFDRETPEKPLTVEMDKYGFSDFNSPGDAIAHTLGGYEFDHLIAGSAITWLRKKGQDLSAEGKPWSLTVSLINPHDIMYFNADAPGENIQDTGKLLMHAARAPNHHAYQKQWNAPLPSSLRQPLDEKGRPQAHAEFHRAWGYTLGNIPPNESNWNRFTNYYLNSIKQVDYQLSAILNELDSLGLSDNTVIIFTADHGEMGGSHGLRGKGPFAYKEALHVPMYVVHPDVSGGQVCKSLTSHIDLAPTLMSLAGVSKQDLAKYAGRELSGKDISTVLSNPNQAGVHAVREKALFTYSGLITNDSEVAHLLAEAKASGKNPKDAIQKSGYKPDLKKRGSLRTVFDGRYKFTRYFAPTERNSPKNDLDLWKNNDLELFDLKNDPGEMKNLADNSKTNQGLISEMSTKLESAIKEEIGKDDGREMPDFPGIKWAIDRLDL